MQQRPQHARIGHQAAQDAARLLDRNTGYVLENLLLLARIERAPPLIRGPALDGIEEASGHLLGFVPLL